MFTPCTSFSFARVFSKHYTQNSKFCTLLEKWGANEGIKKISGGPWSPLETPLLASANSERSGDFIEISLLSSISRKIESFDGCSEMKDEIS